MYTIAAGFASEVARFRGGAKAMAASITAGAEAMRLLRWPAERLDTLGGYLSYHNVTMFVFFLSLFAAVQGARAVRGPELRNSLEEILATGWSRPAVIRDRAAGYAVVLALICGGVGLGLAASMAAGGQPDAGGSMITAAACGLCAFAAYALGMLISQLTPTARAASGVAALAVSGLYVFTNVWQKMGPLAPFRFASPFFYYNQSRALVPGHGFDVPAMLILVAMAVVMLTAAAWAFQRRDYAAPLWGWRPRQARVQWPERPSARVQRPQLRWFWSAALIRERYGLLAWSGAAAVSMWLMASLEPTVVDMWDRLKLVQNFIGTRPGVSAADQYLSFAAEIVAPIIAAFVIVQAAGWVADLRQGRVEFVLATPVSWPRLVGERLAALIAGVAVITAGAIAGLAIGAAAAGVSLAGPGLIRLAALTILLGAALGALAAILVAWLRSGLAVTLLAVAAAASYLLTYLVSLFDWPGWVNRLSVFGAFGRPYLEIPAVGGLVFLAVLAVIGSLAAAAIASRSPKAA